MKYQIKNYENGIVNQGNVNRICSVFDRARAGEKLTIGFVGGSITMGSVSSTPEKCYAYLVYSWWKANFPNAEFVYLNAGIGATDSQFACARAEEDLLQYRPDFVIIEFSVNDEPNAHYLETYEGIVRKVYGAEHQSAILLVHNVFYNNGSSAQLWHARIARHYNLPAVSMQSTIYTELLAGRIENRAITPDDLHPNDEGHALVASVITYYLDQLLVNKADSSSADSMPEPLTANGFENSVRYRNRNISPEAKGFAADTEEQKTIGDVFKNGWTAAKIGDRIKFTVKGSSLAVQYRKTIQKPAPIALCILDGEEENAILLDANFEETWGDKLVLQTLLEHGESKEHTIEIILTETHKEDKLPFYLVSVIASDYQK